MDKNKPVRVTPREAYLLLLQEYKIIGSIIEKQNCKDANILNEYLSIAKDLKDVAVKLSFMP